MHVPKSAHLHLVFTVTTKLLSRLWLLAWLRALLGVWLFLDLTLGLPEGLAPVLALGSRLGSWLGSMHIMVKVIKVKSAQSSAWGSAVKTIQHLEFEEISV